MMKLLTAKKQVKKSPFKATILAPPPPDSSNKFITKARYHFICSIYEVFGLTQGSSDEFIIKNDVYCISCSLTCYHKLSQEFNINMFIFKYPTHRYLLKILLDN